MGAPTSIANAVTEGFKLLKTILDTKEVRDMRKAIEAGEKYIFVHKKNGEFADITDERQTKLLKHYSKRFFHYN